MLCFEDVAMALRQAERDGVTAEFVVDRDFTICADSDVRLVGGQRLDSKTLPSILGWVAAGLPLRLA